MYRNGTKDMCCNNINKFNNILKMDGHGDLCGFPNEPCSCGLSPEYNKMIRKGLGYTFNSGTISREVYNKLMSKYNV